LKLFVLRSPLAKPLKLSRLALRDGQSTITFLLLLPFETSFELFTRKKISLNTINQLIEIMKPKNAFQLLSYYFQMSFKETQNYIPVAEFRTLNSMEQDQKVSLVFSQFLSLLDFPCMADFGNFEQESLGRDFSHEFKRVIFWHFPFLAWFSFPSINCNTI